MSNPRKPFDDEEIQRLADSIKKNGIVDPVEVDSHRVVGGYRRLAVEGSLRAEYNEDV